MDDDSNLAPGPPWLEIINKIRARTPARIFVERGPAYSTQMGLDLRRAHASAVDAVWTEFELQKDFPPEFISEWDLFQVSSEATSKSQFLLRPDLGRRLSNVATDLIRQRCTTAPDLQIVLGDGLSVAALSAQAPSLFPLLQQKAHARGWSVGQPFVVQYCRVGIMNDIGDLLAPRILVLLIGERPGLATAESLSAYLGFSPRSGHTDADRNLISNIHGRGTSLEDASEQILRLAERMMEKRLSGTTLKTAE